MRDELEHLALDFREIASNAIEKWGWQAQKMKLLEECSELIQAIAKHSNGQGSWKQILEEAADVDIMIGQLKHFIVTPTFYDFREEKIKRLRELLEEDKR